MRGPWRRSTPEAPAAILVRALALGVVGGLRSQLPFALLALVANLGSFARGAGKPLGWLRDPRVAAGLGISALGEEVADKLPQVPSRLKPGPLAGRLALGGLAGAALAREAGVSAAAGGVSGAAGAGLGSYGGYHARTTLVRRTGWPDPIWAVVEETVALGIGFVALRHRPRRW